VLNILIMAVLERVNDIAILKSFGLSRRHHADLRLQGLVIVGSVIGLVLGKLPSGLRRLPIQMDS
jgi:ABC-type lipoprotein release transport system permease subunit